MHLRPGCAMHAVKSSPLEQMDAGRSSVPVMTMPLVFTPTYGGRMRVLLAEPWPLSKRVCERAMQTPWPTRGRPPRLALQTQAGGLSASHGTDGGPMAHRETLAVGMTVLR